MNTTVLDGFTLNPGDLSWDALQSLGPCTIYDRTESDLIIERGRNAGALLTNKTVLNRATIEALPDLKYIGVLATGYNVVDVAAAKQRGVIVTNVPAYSTKSVAQTVFALLLELTHQVGHHSAAVHERRWTKCADFSFWDTPLIELDGLTLGLIGFGAIAQAVAGIGRALGMKIIVHSRTVRDQAGVAFVDLETLFRQSDVVSLHCPLTPQTQGIVNEQRLAWMKPSAFLINTARGALVDERALADALDSGRIAGAGVDVLSTEPPAGANPLLRAKNCIITPHFAWASKAARTRLMSTAVSNLSGFLRGFPVNVVG